MSQVPKILNNLTVTLILWRWHPKIVLFVTAVHAVKSLDKDWPSPVPLRAFSLGQSWTLPVPFPRLRAGRRQCLATGRKERPSLLTPCLGTWLGLTSTRMTCKRRAWYVVVLGEDTPLETGLVWELKLQILVLLRVFRTKYQYFWP